MKRYLDVLMDSDRVERPVPHWDALLGADLRQTLARKGILDAAPQATLWPCDGGYTGCPMRVLPTPTDREHPFTASCGAGLHCDDIKLRASDVQQLGSSFERLVAFLRRLFMIEGDAFATPSEIAPRAFRLGVTRTATEARDVVLAIAPVGTSFALLVQSLVASARPTVLLVSSSSRVSADATIGHGPADRVEIVFLDDLLVMRDGDIALARPREVKSTESVSASFARRLDGRGGDVPLSEVDHARALTEESNVDLFVDAVRLRRRKDDPEGYVGSVRGIDGARTAFTLKPKETAALIELVSRRTYCEPRQLRALAGIGHPERIVHRMRRHFDAEPYRFVKTHLGESTKAHTYAFAPDPPLIVLVLAPAT